MLDLGRSLVAVGRAQSRRRGGRRRRATPRLRAPGSPRSPRVAAGLERLGLGRGDRLLMVLQNRIEMATPALGLPTRRHRRDAAQLARQGGGGRLLPRRRRGQGGGVRAGLGRSGRRRGTGRRAAAHRGRRRARHGLLRRARRRAARRRRRAPDAEDMSLMLYTSGTTGRPKGVPRRHRAERAAAVAHVAQNLYARGERTLGVMPLYHTMGVRSLLAMALIDGCFVCQPRFDAGRGARPHRARAGDQSLSRADALSRSAGARRVSRAPISAPAASSASPARRCRTGCCGASPTASGPTSSSTITAHPRSTPSPSSRTPRESRARPARPGSTSASASSSSAPSIPRRAARPARKAQIIAELSSDEAFEGYWRRPDADARALQRRLVLHRRHRLFRCATATSSSPAGSTT